MSAYSQRITVRTPAGAWCHRVAQEEETDEDLLRVGIEVRIEDDPQTGSSIWDITFTDEDTGEPLDATTVLNTPPLLAYIDQMEKQYGDIGKLTINVTNLPTPVSQPTVRPLPAPMGIGIGRPQAPRPARPTAPARPTPVQTQRH